jgi:hypothetical protein
MSKALGLIPSTEKIKKKKNPPSPKLNISVPGNSSK